MSVKATHPLYDAHIEDWITARDAYKGERQVKSKGQRYLPATSGMLMDGMDTPEAKGSKNYQAYVDRAVFHDFFREGVERLVGIMHQKDAIFELPAKLQPLLKNATLAGESLQLLLRRMNEEQLVTGRIGLLADLPSSTVDNSVLPYITTYIAESIRNWDDATATPGTYALNMITLDESSYVRDGMNWTYKERYRVLMLGQSNVNEEDKQGAIFRSGVFDSDLVDSELKPSSYIGRTLDEIPFVFVNTKDVLSRPDVPPALGLIQLSLAIYRGEADYRQSLFMQGQDTLVVIGSLRDPSGELRIGAGARIDVDTEGDAKFIGVSSQGLPEMRMCLEADRKRATIKSAQLVSTEKGVEESGVALNTRVAAQTATLNSIAKTGAAALERLLKIIAKWVGANPEEVSVLPNLEFTSSDLFGDDLLKLIQARNMGAPISLESIHHLASGRGIATKTFEDEMAAIELENAKFGLAFGEPEQTSDNQNNDGGGNTGGDTGGGQ